MSHTIGHTKKSGIREDKDARQYEDHITKVTVRRRAIDMEMSLMEGESVPFFWEQRGVWGQYTDMGTFHTHISPAMRLRRMIMAQHLGYQS